MKYRTPLLASLVGTGMLFAGAAFAQQTIPAQEPTPAQQAMPAQPSAPAQQSMPQQPSAPAPTQQTAPTPAQQSMPAQPAAPAPQPMSSQQAAPAQQPSSSTSMNTPGTTGSNSATFNSAKGQVTVNSGMGQTPSTASPPSFEQLANGQKAISKSAAEAYPPLANDFEYAAHGGNSISKAQYERWLKNLN
ncbi:hypothetical protein [Dyella acidiphila]|uniref:Uncharacterized protein n=1 Tax=Dyella acidiphila TaxID=2775866 RepID=A0ABR9G6U6_9GAMM|nr:hypothetical protein [Dyella acidiphila]MBE1159769.1 hypothetical protein [Dyella acidiphila]